MRRVHMQTEQTRARHPHTTRLHLPPILRTTRRGAPRPCGGTRTPAPPQALPTHCKLGHRDVTAGLSLARAGLAALLGLARPAYLSRAHAEEPDAHPVPRYPMPHDLVRASSRSLLSHTQRPGPKQQLSPALVLFAHPPPQLEYSRGGWYACHCVTHDG